MAPRTRTTVVYSPYYSFSRGYRPYYGYNSFSLGVGLGYYDPFYSYGYWPYSYRSYGYPYYGYPYGSYGTYGYGSYGYGSYGSGAYDQVDVHYGVGAVRLKVKPRHAQVAVDGYFVGAVDQFDGVFQRLRLESGTHRIEITADGYQPLAFDVRILPGDTITYEQEMVPLP